MTNTSSEYRASFTAGALLFHEFNVLLPYLTQPDAIQLINEEIDENNVLKIKTEAARIRVTTEVKRRLKFTNETFWLAYQSISESDQKLLLFYLILKAHPLVMDFHQEVVMKKWRRLQTEIHRDDLLMRLDELASQDEEVESWSESTKIKTATQYIRILREAGLMKKNKLIKAEAYQSELWTSIQKWGDNWFMEACFLSKSEIESLA